MRATIIQHQLAWEILNERQPGQVSREAETIVKSLDRRLSTFGHLLIAGSQSEGFVPIHKKSVVGTKLNYGSNGRSLRKYLSQLNHTSPMLVVAEPNKFEVPIDIFGRVLSSFGYDVQLIGQYPR
jgi:hypothetical protein